MDCLRAHPAGFAVLALMVVVSCRDLRAQTSLASTAASSATSAAASAGTGTGMGMSMGGMGLMPMMAAMNPSASLSPTDAAAMGQATSNGALGMNPMNGVFMNPMAAPYLLGFPMSNSQIAGMMLMNQTGGGGIGSGQMSGVRPGPGQQKGRTNKAAEKSRGTASTPAGLATRYFNRTISVNRPVNVSRIPQSFYTRQNRYYPQVAR